MHRQTKIDSDIIPGVGSPHCKHLHNDNVARNEAMNHKVQDPGFVYPVPALLRVGLGITSGNVHHVCPSLFSPSYSEDQVYLGSFCSVHYKGRKSRSLDQRDDNVVCLIVKPGSFQPHLHVNQELVIIASPDLSGCFHDPLHLWFIYFQSSLCHTSPQLICPSKQTKRNTPSIILTIPTLPPV